MKSKAFFLLFAFSFFAQILVAQKTGVLFHTITLKLPQIASLSLTNNSNTAKLLKSSSHSVIIKNSNSWLNYHSILNIASPEPSKSIKAQISNNNSNFSIAIITSNDSGNGIGEIGKPAKDSIVLNNSIAKTIIDDIGVAYTGRNVYDGHNLTYLITPNNEKTFPLQLNSPQFSIIYTLFDN